MSVYGGGMDSLSKKGFGKLEKYLERIEDVTDFALIKFSDDNIIVLEVIVL